jgi:hypothetical protein
LLGVAVASEGTNVALEMELASVSSSAWFGTGTALADISEPDGAPSQRPA